jgi:uroporphyrinogen-III synthase
MTVHLALRTVSLESRRSEELGRLLARHGLQPISAPSLREVPLTDQAEALAFGEALLAGECDVLVLLTGVGVRVLLDALSVRFERARVVEALAGVQLACRGPKPVAVLKELGLSPQVTAPEPNTWRELAAALGAIPLEGRRVWVQEYGRSNEPLLGELRARGAEVRTAAVYAWRLPEDLAPLERAVALLCDGGADAVLFTAAQQLEHLLEVAARGGRRDVLLSALRARVLVGSIGPVTSEALAERGVRADLEPEHPKMGHLVKTLARDGLQALERKRALT